MADVTLDVVRTGRREVLQSAGTVWKWKVLVAQKRNRPSARSVLQVWRMARLVVGEREPFGFWTAMEVCCGRTYERIAAWSSGARDVSWLMSKTPLLLFFVWKCIS